MKEDRERPPLGWVRSGVSGESAEGDGTGLVVVSRDARWAATGGVDPIGEEGGEERGDGGEAAVGEELGEAVVAVVAVAGGAVGGGRGVGEGGRGEDVAGHGESGVRRGVDEEGDVRPADAASEVADPDDVALGRGRDVGRVADFRVGSLRPGAVDVEKLALKEAEGPAKGDITGGGAEVDAVEVGGARPVERPVGLVGLVRDRRRVEDRVQRGRVRRRARVVDNAQEFFDVREAPVRASAELEGFAVLERRRPIESLAAVGPRPLELRGGVEDDVALGLVGGLAPVPPDEDHVHGRPTRIALDSAVGEVDAEDR
mmetsp:Transcript_1804/g.5489  ORF Transcript_1804/g.5489 Transcript_1804/m.5489 type:complete len:315 (-) Transcript_1804:535-1479(-)